MNPEILKSMERKGLVRARSKDIPRIKSLIKSSKSVTSEVLNLQINERTSTIIFREMYESIKQLGDALCWSMGYEAETHEPSIRVLAEADVKDKVSLNKLDRFRKIRNDSNYRGYMATPEQAKDIVNFWKRCSGDIIAYIEKKTEK